MPEQFGDKTHDATPHRRQQAREQGQVAKSQDLASAVNLIGAVLVLMFLGPPVVRFLYHLLQNQLGGQAWLRTDQPTAVFHWRATIWQLASVLAPVFGVMALVAIAAHVGQIGFILVPDKLAPDPKRINPLKGMQRIFSLAGMVRLLLGIFKVLIVASVGCWCVWKEHETVLGLATLEVPQIGLLIVRLTLSTCLWIGGALLVLALLDFAYQRWKHEQDLRMTTQEIREEMKTLQGDPQVLARRRAVQRQLVMNRLQNVVPQADVVITNPTELAVAIKYDPHEMAAPVVVAKGAGQLAQRIRQLAMEHDIPIVERKPLAQALYRQVDVQQAIPMEQYAAVAEVLRYVYQLKGKTVPGMDPAA